jgi:hypothetical protein
MIQELRILVRKSAPAYASGTKSYSPMPCRIRKVAAVSPPLVTRCALRPNRIGLAWREAHPLLGVAQEDLEVSPEHVKVSWMFEWQCHGTFCLGLIVYSAIRNPGREA